jgi:hypothetical protein
MMLALLIGVTESLDVNIPKKIVMIITHVLLIIVIVIMVVRILGFIVMIMIIVLMIGVIILPDVFMTDTPKMSAMITMLVLPNCVTPKLVVNIHLLSAKIIMLVPLIGVTRVPDV